MPRYNNNQTHNKRGKVATSFRRTKVQCVRSGKKFKQARKLLKKARTRKSVSDAPFAKPPLTSTMINTPTVSFSSSGKKKRKRRRDTLGGSSKAGTSLVTPATSSSVILSGNMESADVSISSSVCADLSYKFRNDHITAWQKNLTYSDISEGTLGCVEADTIVIEDDEDKTITPEVVGNIMLNMMEEGKNKKAANHKPKAEPDATIVLNDTADDDVIILDDTNFPPLPSTSKQPPLVRSNLQEIMTRYPQEAAPDFIPLYSGRGGREIQRNLRRSPRSIARGLAARRTTKRLQPRPKWGTNRHVKGTVSKSSPEQLHGHDARSDVVVAAGPTTFSSSSSNTQAGQLRPIVIDGSNVAMNHGKNKVFSVKGIEMVINYFAVRGHKKIKAFLPQFYDQYNKTNDKRLLDKLNDDGFIVYTPSRTVDNKRINSYDDSYILDYAALNGAIVVTRDFYRDLIDKKAEWREVIEKRILQPTFPDEDSLMIPNDPLGRDGPTLDEFLRY